VSKGDDPFDDRPVGPVLSVRFGAALALVVLGIAWVVFYYLGPRPLRLEPSGPDFMTEIARWNYVIGFGLFFLGLIVAAHPTTPLGRGRGVVVGMLGCFILGLIWICTFYVLANNQLDAVPVMNDLRQSNLIVGIAFMGVGFTYATKWE